MLFISNGLCFPPAISSFSNAGPLQGPNLVLCFAGRVCFAETQRTAGFCLNEKTFSACKEIFPLHGAWHSLTDMWDKLTQEKSWDDWELPSSSTSFYNWKHLPKIVALHRNRKSRPKEMFQHAALWTLYQEPGALHSRWNTGNFLESAHFHPKPPEIKINVQQMLPAGTIGWHLFQLDSFKIWWCNCSAARWGLENRAGWWQNPSPRSLSLNYIAGPGV